MKPKAIIQQTVITTAKEYLQPIWAANSFLLLCGAVQLRLLEVLAAAVQLSPLEVLAAVVLLSTLEVLAAVVLLSTTEVLAVAAGS